MEPKPLVSIITPSYNQGDFLERTIQSVLSLEYANLEYILIDGGSTDGSVEIIKKYEQNLTYWVSEKDKGQTDAINKGFTKASGSILAWLNSDDLYYPRAVTEAVEYLGSHPGTGMVYSDLDFIDENDRVIGKFPAAQTDLNKLRRGYVHIPQPCAFFRREHWEQVGPLDPSFYFAMDYDLWVRLAGITKLQYLPGRSWAKFRLHSQGKTISADDRCWPEMLKVHYRDGGHWIAPIVGKYYLRKIISPLINRKRQRLFKK